MITLAKHQANRAEMFLAQGDVNRPRPNGIACPNCAKELMDSNPACVLTSNPPQKNTHCPACGYRGYRFA